VFSLSLIIVLKLTYIFGHPQWHYVTVV